MASQINASKVNFNEAGWLLSIRELEVVKLLAAGLVSKQIADQLQISVHTVDTHRRNLLRKTGAKNTLEVVAICMMKKLI